MEFGDCPLPAMIISFIVLFIIGSTGGKTIIYLFINNVTLIISLSLVLNVQEY